MEVIDVNALPDEDTTGICCLLYICSYRLIKLANPWGVETIDSHLSMVLNAG